MDAWVAAGGWVAGASALAFVLAAWDKARAQSGRSRVPERTLLGLALVGGSPGLVLAMLLARHKTRKLGFLAPLALIVVAQVLVVAWLLR